MDELLTEGETMATETKDIPQIAFDNLLKRRPWLTEAPDLQGDVIVTDSEHVVIVRVRDYGPEQFKVARLIAAAPELLAVAKLIAAMPGTMIAIIPDKDGDNIAHEVKDLAAAAISKAEGK